MLLRVSPLLALAAGAQDSADSREDITIWNTLQQTFGGVGQVARKKDPQELKVINIGLARTATSSFVTAMRELGIKSYHMKDGVQDSDGHADLWIDHAALALDEADEAKPGWRTDPAVVASRAAVFKKIAEDGFNATADMPMNGYYKELLELYPKRSWCSPSTRREAPSAGPTRCGRRSGATPSSSRRSRLRGSRS